MVTASTGAVPSKASAERLTSSAPCPQCWRSRTGRRGRAGVAVGLGFAGPALPVGNAGGGRWVGLARRELFRIGGQALQPGGVVQSAGRPGREVACQSLDAGRHAGGSDEAGGPLQQGTGRGGVAGRRVDHGLQVEPTGILRLQPGQLGVVFQSLLQEGVEGFGVGGQA